jgi:hypothetical protein
VGAFCHSPVSHKDTISPAAIATVLSVARRGFRTVPPVLELSGLFEEGLGLLQIRCIKPFREPVVDIG